MEVADEILLRDLFVLIGLAVIVVAIGWPREGDGE